MWTQTLPDDRDQVAGSRGLVADDRDLPHRGQLEVEGPQRWAKPPG